MNVCSKCGEPESTGVIISTYRLTNCSVRIMCAKCAYEHEEKIKNENKRT